GCSTAPVRCPLPAPKYQRTPAQLTSHTSGRSHGVIRLPTSNNNGLPLFPLVSRVPKPRLIPSPVTALITSAAGVPLSFMKLPCGVACLLIYSYRATTDQGRPSSTYSQPPRYRIFPPLCGQKLASSSPVFFFTPSFPHNKVDRKAS